MTKGFDYKGYKIQIASENKGFIVEIKPQKCSLPRLLWRTFDLCSGSEEEALAEARQRIDEAFGAAQDGRQLGTPRPLHLRGFIFPG